jgi:hypothetical protein
VDLRQAKGISRLAALRDAEPTTTSHWPGRPELPVRIRSLTTAQVLECRAAAYAELEAMKIPVNQFTIDALEEEIATQILFRVVRDAERPEPFALSVDDLRQHSTPDERAAMMRVYEEHRASVDPDPATMSAETLDGLVDALKKKGPTALKSIGRATLERLLLSMVALPVTSQTGKSSTTSES